MRTLNLIIAAIAWTLVAIAWRLPTDIALDQSNLQARREGIPPTAERSVVEMPHSSAQ